MFGVWIGRRIGFYLDKISFLRIERYSNNEMCVNAVAEKLHQCNILINASSYVLLCVCYVGVHTWFYGRALTGCNIR